MRKSRFTETQIVSILKEADAGMPVNEVWRKHGISSATFYKWKAKYGGLEAADRAAASDRPCRAGPVDAPRMGPSNTRPARGLKRKATTRVAFSFATPT